MVTHLHLDHGLVRAGNPASASGVAGSNIPRQGCIIVVALLSDLFITIIILGGLHFDLIFIKFNHFRPLELFLANFVLVIPFRVI